MNNQIESPILALQKQRQLLQMEYEAEKEEFREQTEKMGLQRKIKRGDVWFPLTIGKIYFNSLNQKVIEVYREAEEEEVEHNFEYGKPVVFFSVDIENKISYFKLTANVSYVDGNRMVVAVPDGMGLVEIQSAEKLGVQLFFDETSYKMMFAALDKVISAKGRLAYLRDLFYNKVKAETFSFNALHFPYLNAT